MLILTSVIMTIHSHFKQLRKVIAVPHHLAIQIIQLVLHLERIVFVFKQKGKLPG